MDARMLRYFNQELRYLREQGAEFAQAFPKIASRLSMEGLEVADPYVERLLEGCAFLAARVQLKQDAEFPRFSHRLLDLVYPGFLAPIPSMLVAQVNAVPDPNLLKGHAVPRDPALIAPRSPRTDTRCEFRTCQDLVLTPLSVVAADYFLNMSDLVLSGHTLPERPRSGVRVSLQLSAGVSVSQLAVDRLRFYIAGQTDVAMRLHELIMSGTIGVLVGPPGREGDGKRKLLPNSALSPVGYDEAQAMLPVTLRGLSGVRLLQEHFAFPERFLFFDLEGLRGACAGIAGGSVELTFLFSRPGRSLDGIVSAANFALNCVPAINLFPKRADRIELDEGHFEYQVVPDRTRPLDFEVYDVLSLHGYDDSGSEPMARELQFHAGTRDHNGFSAGSGPYLDVAFRVRTQCVRSFSQRPSWPPSCAHSHMPRERTTNAPGLRLPSKSTAPLAPPPPGMCTRRSVKRPNGMPKLSFSG